MTHAHTCRDNYCDPGGRPRPRAGEGPCLLCELEISATASVGSVNEDGQNKLTNAKTSPGPRSRQHPALSSVSSHFSLFDSTFILPPLCFLTLLRLHASSSSSRSPDAGNGAEPRTCESPRRDLAPGLAVR